MPIRFTCATITRFDSATGEYVRCERVLSVDDPLVGSLIVCPGCKQRVQVPQMSDSRLEEPAAKTQQALASVTAAGVDHRRDRAQPAAASPMAPAPKVVGSAVATPKSEEAAPLSFSSFSTTVRCKKCGGRLDDTRRCVQCGHQAVLTTSSRDSEPKPVQLAGFQRWLARFMPQGNVATLVGAMHALVGLVLLVVVVMGFAGGGLGTIVALLLAAILGVGYAYLVYDFRRIARNPEARLSPWQGIGWSLILEICRATKWNFLRSGPSFRVLDLRGSGCSESELLARSDLVEFEVIDAEKLPLTDAGLARLKGLRRLQRLVIRGSGVSQAAVFRLQQDLPDAWIWN